MAVYEISDELKQYLRSCPKTHRKDGVITEWRESDILESLELEEIISNFSNLLYGDYGYNRIKEYLAIDKKYREKEIKRIDNSLENENLSKEQIDMLEEWKVFLLKFKPSFIVVPSDSFPNFTYKIINVKYLLEHELSDYRFSVKNEKLRIVPKKKRPVKIEFQKQKGTICFYDKDDKVLIIKMRPKLFVLYNFMYDKVKDSGRDTCELIDAENELKNYFHSRYEYFFNPNERKKDVVDMICEINALLIKKEIPPYYCIKQNIENEKGGKFRISAFEINREE